MHLHVLQFLYFVLIIELCRLTNFEGIEGLWFNRIAYIQVQVSIHGIGVHAYLEKDYTIVNSARQTSSEY